MVHPEVLKAYNEAEYEYYKRAEDYNEEQFFEQIEGAKSPIKREIIKVVRLKNGDKEVFYYHEELKGTNYLGNTIHLYRVGGKWDLPVFNFQVDKKTNKKFATDIDHTEPQYELEWPKDWTKELEKDVTEKTDLVIVTISRKYNGFDFDDYKDNSLENLKILGRFGSLDPALIEAEKARQSKVKK